MNLTEEESEVITSAVIELNNYISNSQIDKETCIEIREQLKNIINESLIDIEKKDIKNIDDYNDLTYKILSKIMKIRLQMEIYIKDVEKYAKHTR